MYPASGPVPAQPNAGWAVEWVASPPGLPHYGVAAPPPRRYTGPPSYPLPPRWGFPRLTWRRLAWVPGTPVAPPRPVARTAALASSLVPALWITAGAALLAATAEGWRYALLLRSRTEALAPESVAVSDAMVATMGVLAGVAAAVAGLLTVLWMLRARETAARETGVRPARPDWQVVAGVLVPGLNLVLPGLLLAELEHAAQRLPAQQRPRPSRRLIWWWAMWAGNALLWVVAALWSLRSGVQARADGVVLHALVDVSAAVVAALTALHLRALTKLITPFDPRRLRRLLVVGVSGAPDPPLRPARMPTSPR